MAIYSTFFLCDPLQLQQGFPGWKPPLDKPVTRKSVNPFTRQEMTIESREPQWDDVDPETFESAEVTVVAIEGDYATYLEQRIPAFVQSLPHWCAKNLTSVEMEPLIEAAGVTTTEMASPLRAHPSLSSSLGGFDPAFTAALKSAGESELITIAERWAATMSTPDYTHSVDGKRIQDDMTTDESMYVLSPLAELAQKQTGAQQLYLLNEW